MTVAKFIELSTVLR